MQAKVATHTGQYYAGAQNATQRRNSCNSDFSTRRSQRAEARSRGSRYHHHCMGVAVVSVLFASELIEIGLEIGRSEVKFIPPAALVQDAFSGAYAFSVCPVVQQ